MFIIILLSEDIFETERCFATMIPVEQRIEYREHSSAFASSSPFCLSLLALRMKLSSLEVFHCLRTLRSFQAFGRIRSKNDRVSRVCLVKLLLPVCRGAFREH